MSILGSVAFTHPEEILRDIRSRLGLITMGACLGAIVRGSPPHRTIKRNAATSD